MTVGVLLVLVFVCFAGCCWLDWVVCCLSLVNLLFCSDYLCCCFCVLRVVILDLRFGVLWDLLFWICVSFAFPGWRPYCCICFLVLLYFAGFCVLSIFYVCRFGISRFCLRFAGNNGPWGWYKTDICNFVILKFWLIWWFDEFCWVFWFSVGFEFGFLGFLLISWILVIFGFLWGFCVLLH